MTDELIAADSKDEWVSIPAAAKHFKVPYDWVRAWTKGRGLQGGVIRIEPSLKSIRYYKSCIKRKKKRRPPKRRWLVSIPIMENSTAWEKYLKQKENK